MDFMCFAAAEASGATNLLDSSVVTFVFNAASQFISLLTTPPLGTFITIGILGAVGGLVGGLVSMARGRH